MNPEGLGYPPLGVKVKFAPGADQMRQFNGQLRITSDAMEEVLSVDLSGTGVEFATEVDETPIDFGLVRAKTVHQESVRVYNAGSDTLTITPSFAAYSHPSFSLDPTTAGPIFIPGGHEETINVNFEGPEDTEEEVNGELVLDIEGDPNSDSKLIQLKGRANKPVLAENLKLDFGVRRAGTEPEETVTVTNTGSRAITFTSIGEPSNAAFSIRNKPTGAVTLEPGGGANSTLSLTVRFSVPTVTEDEVTGSITLTNQDATDPDYSTYTIPLSGSGNKPVLVRDPTAGLAFGAQRAGTDTDAMVTVTNTGSRAITFTSIGNPSNTAFTLRNKPTGAVTLEPGGGANSTLSLTVRFRAPTSSEALVSGSIALVNTDPDYSTYTIPLSGSGNKPVLASNPTNGLAFGAQRAGTDTNATVTVTNTGSRAITFTSIGDPSHSAFTLRNKPTGAVTLEPGGGANSTLSLMVRFRAPTDTEVPVSGTIALVNTDPAYSTYTIPLSGSGNKPMLVRDPTAGLAFGAQRAGTDTDATVTVTNTGSRAITFTSIGDPSHSAFTLRNKPTGSVTLEPGGGANSTLSLTVRFRAPSDTEAPASGSIALVNTDPDYSTYTIPLSGSSDRPVLVRDPTAGLEFGAQRAGTDTDATVTVTNTGSRAITFTSIGNPSNTAFTLLDKPTGAVTLEPGGGANSKLSLTVRFRAPTNSETPVSGSIALVNTDPAYSTYTIPLSGSGNKPVLVRDPTAGLEFGAQRAGTDTDATVTVTNTGSRAITFTSIGEPSNAAFTLRNKPTGSVTLQPGGGANSTLSLTVRFRAPTNSETPVSGSIALVNTDPDYSTYTIPLSGSGNKPVLVRDPTAGLAFGARRAGTDTDATVTVTNTGSRAITFTSIGNPTHSAFTLLSKPASPVTLQAGGGANSTLSLTVRFRAPTDTEVPVSGSIALVNTDPDYSTYTIPLSGSGNKPVLVMSPTDGLDFGDKRGGTDTMMTVTVSNSGTRAITFTSIGNPTHAAFTLLNKPSGAVTLEPEGQGVSSLSLNVNFHAPEASDSLVQATFALVNTDPTYSNYAVKLKGRGVKPAIDPVPDVDFDEVRVGVVKRMPVVITNSGSGPVTFADVVIEGNSAFTLDPPISRNTPVVINPGTTTLTVQFLPTIESETPVRGTLKLFSSDPAIDDLSVGLSGAGVRPVLQMVKTPLAFGDQNVGVPGGTSLQVSLSNSGTGKLHISNIATSGAPFSVSPSLPFDVTRTGGPQVLTVTFSPTRVDSFTGALTLSTNDPGNSSVSLQLSGNGRILLKVDPETSRIDFGSTPVQTTVAQKVTLSNDGSQDIVVQPPVFAVGSPFSSTFTTAVTLGPSQRNFEFQMKFTPTATGPAYESVALDSNASNVTRIALSGSGAEPRMRITVTDDPTQRELNFGNVNVGSRLVRNVTLENTGDAELSLNAFTVEPATPQFRPQVPAKTKLLPAETVVLPVEFVPTANGLVSADLKVSANITGGFMTFPLRGTGLSANIGLSVASLSFNEQKLLQASARKSLTISSSGEAQLLINRIELSAGYSFDPPVTLPSTESPWVLAPKTGLRTLELVFTPTTLGSVPGTLRVYSNAINTVDPVALTGTGVDGVGLTTPQREFSFADTPVGASVRYTVRVENNGGYPLRLVSATSTSASEPNPFTVVNFETNRTLQKNRADYSEFFVDFVPTFHGAHKGTLVIQTDSASLPSISLAMSGNALGPEAFLTTTGPVNFGKINVQATAKAQLAVKNTGQGTLTIQDIAFTNKVSTDGGTSSPDDPSQIFAVGPSADGGLALPVDVASQQVVSIPLTFKPVAMGVREALVTVKSNARDVSKDAVGEGTAPVLTITPPTLEFKGILVGNYSQAQTLTVHNTGNGSVEIDSITMSSNGSDVFIVQPVVTPYLLYPNAELPISVTFQPTAERTSAEVQLIVTPVTGYRVPAVSARLVGKGVLEPITVESELEYGKQLINNPAVRVLHIGNATGEAITFIRATVDSAPGCSQFRSDPAQAGGFTVEPFETKELRILFTPLAEGPLNCNLKLEFGQFRDKLPVALHGEGIRAVLSVNTTTLDFGSLRAGVDRRVERIALRNLSSDTVKLAEPEETSSTGERFKIDLLSLKDRLLEPDVPLYVDVEYQPQGETLSKSTLLFGTKEPLLLRSVEVQLAGKATKQILGIDQTEVDFGRVDVNANPVSKTMTITNGSSQAQRVLVSMQGQTGSPFSTNVGASGLDIPAQGSATFTVSFDPTDSGNVEDKVLIKLQDSSTADMVLTVKGAGRTLSGQGNGLGCSASGAWGSAGVLALLALVGLRSRRRRRE
ncbi:choice-of-anchor D domain-containing protein [Cystobacter fuscus]|uniref:choice-of-anchor D domain-containing protein n=1 Tax=Cystobacter fuscus TaxID=43 RepID=UPI0018DF3E1F|nr:choice-of-anchor D domain-containing protein [Cystobacter fuscus]